MEYIQLNNGIKMPSIGFGVYQIPLLMTKQCVLDALAIGYRHIDTARNYGNEREVGEADHLHDREPFRSMHDVVRDGERRRKLSQHRSYR